MRPTLFEMIKTSQASDSQLLNFLDGVQNGKMPEFNVLDEEILRYRSRLCVPNNAEIEIML